MQPTVGRIVNYRIGGEVWAAIITAVRSAVDIDVTVFPPGRAPAHRQHVTEGEKDSQWSWPVLPATKRTGGSK